MLFPEGNYCAMVTPFCRDGSIDINAVETIVTRLTRNGFKGVLVAGTTGEGALLNDRQYVEIIRSVRACADGMLVIAGVGASGTNHAILNACAADEAGADAALAIMPYYFRAGDVDVVDFYRILKKSTRLPIIAYEFPRIAGQSIRAEEAEELTSERTVIGIKDSSGDIVTLTVLQQKIGTAVSLFQGLATLTVPSFVIGVRRVFSATSSLIPELDRALMDSLNAADWTTATALQAQQIMLVRALTKSGCPIGTGVKLGLEAVGTCSSATLYPTRARSTSTTEIIDFLGSVHNKISDLGKKMS